MRILKDANVLASELIALNPTLTEVSRQPRILMKEVDFIQGVVHKFSPADIDYFLRFRGTSSGTPLDARQKTIVSRLDPAAGVSDQPGWIMSPATLDLIDRQIASRAPASGRAAVPALQKQLTLGAFFKKKFTY